MAARLSQRKLDNILSTGARAVITGNAGCLLQIAREARARDESFWVGHTIDLLDLSFHVEKRLGVRLIGSGVSRPRLCSGYSAYAARSGIDTAAHSPAGPLRSPVRASYRAP